MLLLLPPRDAVEQLVVLRVARVESLVFVLRGCDVGSGGEGRVLGRERRRGRSGRVGAGRRRDGRALHRAGRVVGAGGPLAEPRAGAAGRLVVVNQVLQPSDVLHGEPERVHLAQLLARSPSAVRQRGDDVGRDVLAQVGEAVVHLFHAVALARVATLHRLGLRRPVWHVRVRQLWFLARSDAVLLSQRSVDRRGRDQPLAQPVVRRLG